MTTPDNGADIGPGTDVTVGVDDLADPEKPATRDPDEMSDDGVGELGGTGGEDAGGAG